MIAAITKWKFRFRTVDIGAPVDKLTLQPTKGNLMQTHSSLMVALISITVLTLKLSAADPRYSEKPLNGPSQTPARSQLVSPKIATPAQTVVALTQPNPYSIPGLGGKIYATGKSDVIVKTIYIPRVWLDEVYLLSGGSKIYLGSNRQETTVTNLGKLPAGEIMLMMKVRETGGITLPDTGMEYLIGPGTRNPDQKAHTTVNVAPGGAIEVGWEDRINTPRESECLVTAFRLPHSRRGLWFSDAFLQFSGGVTTDANTISGDHTAAVADLVQVIKEQKGEVRTAALAALKKIDPAAARQFLSP